MFFIIRMRMKILTFLIVWTSVCVSILIPAYAVVAVWSGAGIPFDGAILIGINRISLMAMVAGLWLTLKLNPEPAAIESGLDHRA